MNPAMHFTIKPDYPIDGNFPTMIEGKNKLKVRESSVNEL
jgi:hypothetical protein